LLKEGRRTGFGLLATSTARADDGAELNNQFVDRALVAGFDGYGFLDGRRDWVVTGQMSASWIEGTAPALLRQQTSSRRYYQRPDAEYVRLDPTRDSLTGWSGALGLRNNHGPFTVSGDLWGTSPGFEANDLGFQNRADIAGAATGFTWKKLAPDRLTRERKLDVSKRWVWDFGRRPQADVWSFTGWGMFHNYWELYGGASWSREVFDNFLTRGGPTARAPTNHSTSVGFGTDGRKRFTFAADLTEKGDVSGGWEHYISTFLTIKPNAFLSISSGPYFLRSYDIAQYLDTVADSTATSTYGARYVFANIDQTQMGLTTRVNLSLTPRISLQVYAEPFVGVGEFGAPKELAQAGTFDFLRYGLDVGTLAFDPRTQTYTVDPDGAGPARSFVIANQDFNAKSLVAKAVLRWEWRPGSTFYAAWTQQRFNDAFPGEFDLGRDARALLSAQADNVFLVKLTYWLGR
jgi:hypothetical protein